VDNGVRVEGARDLRQLAEDAFHLGLRETRPDPETISQPPARTAFGEDVAAFVVLSKIAQL
jgi:hypothetical protein